ncbi:DUF3800 domain-containing protein [Aciditerrimonas ferrireducens]|uniref:DUF3800 domain-containing protein n=1 Tax=Aciditerrimonas ferrireducens TaxID=667306 RepID=A0ABV6C960_9ACTN
MTKWWIFGDESGNFDFSCTGTRWFLVGTLTCEDGTVHRLRQQLADLRARVTRIDRSHPGWFHAAEDRQAIRDQVFEALCAMPVRFDVTALEKPKAKPEIRSTPERFYQYAWYYHFKYVLPRVCTSGDTLEVVLADIGTKRQRAAFREALDDVFNQCLPRSVRHTEAFWHCSAEECLQAADYFLWATFRRWERQDERSYQLISHLVQSEFDLFARGEVRYYDWD